MANYNSLLRSSRIEFEARFCTTFFNASNPPVSLGYIWQLNFNCSRIIFSSTRVYSLLSYIFKFRGRWAGLLRQVLSSSLSDVFEANQSKAALEKGFLFCIFARQKDILKEMFKPMAFMWYILDESRHMPFLLGRNYNP